MVVTLNKTLVGVVCKDKLDFQRWVANQGYDELRRYLPITTVADATQKFDELVVTTTASANPNFFDIYVKLNGAYTKAKPEAKAI